MILHRALCTCTHMDTTALRFETVLARFPDSPLWGFHLPVPPDICRTAAQWPDRRVVCTLEDRISIHAALMHDGQGGFFININKEIRTKLKLNQDSPVKVCIVPDTSQYGMPMPEELEAALAQDEQAWQYFHALTPGKQRTILYWCAKPKNPDLRIKRALDLVAHLLFFEGKIDYKKLMGPKGG